jgi:asparagine synthase (glutamine-hydrolysing)
VQHGGFKKMIVGAGKPIWQMLPASRNSKMGNRVRQLRRFAEGLSLSETERYWRWASFCTEEEAAALLVSPKTYTKKSWLEMLERMSSKLHGLNKVLYNDMHLVLPGDMLVKVDRMSMAHSLEVRTPFLDVNVVDRVMRWPAEYKIDAQRQKKILKDAFASVLPPELLSRRKQGFEVPLLRWFCGDLSGYIHELLDEKFLREQNIFKPEPVQQLLRQLASNNPGDAVARVWALVVFQHWWKKNMT